MGNTANIRRLHFEACTFWMADMKTQVASTDPSEPVRKLPFVEKQNRLESQKRRITGLSHRPDQQPSHHLIDQVYSLIETDREMFSLLAAEHSESLKPVAGKEPPLDRTFKRLMHDSRIDVHLIAYPKQQHHSPKTPKRTAEDSGDRMAPTKPKGNPTKPTPQMPVELRGLTSKTADGKPICWHRNFEERVEQYNQEWTLSFWDACVHEMPKGKSWGGRLS